MIDARYLIEEEEAKKQLNVLLDYYDVDLDDYSGMEIDGVKSSRAIEVVFRKLTKAIRRGRLEVVEDDGRVSVKQHLRGAYAEGRKQIVYLPLSGKAKLAMSEYKNNDAKIHALLGALSGLDTSKISILEGSDLSLAECLGGLFLLA